MINNQNYSIDTICAQFNSKHEYNNSTKTNIALSNSYDNNSTDYARYKNYNLTTLEQQLAKLYGNNNIVKFFDNCQRIWCNFIEYFTRISDHITVITNKTVYHEYRQSFEFYNHIDNIDLVFIDINNQQELEQTLYDVTKNSKEEYKNQELYLSEEFILQDKHFNHLIIILTESIDTRLNKYDIKQISNIIKKVNVNNKYSIKLIVDNTLASIYYNNPLLDGADYIIESATKYISGHGDVSGGILATDISNECTINNIKIFASVMGMYINPLSCYLVQRGITTYAIRMEQITKNAKCVYSFIQKYTNNTIYVGTGGIILFSVGNKKQCELFISLLKTIYRSTSYGDTVTTIAYVLTPEVLRLSVGIENITDILLDLKRAFICLQRNSEIRCNKNEN